MHMRMDTRLLLTSPLPANRDSKSLGASFWIKVTFFVVELCLCIVFSVMLLRVSSDIGAVLEWVIAFIFTFYIFSFAIDLFPAARTRGPGKRNSMIKEGEEEGAALETRRNWMDRQAAQV